MIRTNNYVDIAPDHLLKVTDTKIEESPHTAAINFEVNNKCKTTEHKIHNSKFVIASFTTESFFETVKSLIIQRIDQCLAHTYNYNNEKNRKFLHNQQQILEKYTTLNEIITDLEYYLLITEGFLFPTFDHVICIEKNDKLSKLNEGSYGEVFAIDDSYVVKTQKIHNSMKTQYYQAKLEILINQYLSCSNDACNKFMKTYYSSITPEDEVYVIKSFYEKYTYDLFTIYHLYGNPSLTDIEMNDTNIFKNNFKGIMRSLIEQLETLHQNGIAHSDIKPENIMFKCVADTYKVSLIDFGLSKFTGNQITFGGGSWEYFPFRPSSYTEQNEFQMDRNSLKSFKIKFMNSFINQIYKTNYRVLDCYALLKTLYIINYRLGYGGELYNNYFQIIGKYSYEDFYTNSFHNSCYNFLTKLDYESLIAFEEYISSKYLDYSTYKKVFLEKCEIIFNANKTKYSYDENMLYIRKLLILEMLADDNINKYIYNDNIKKYCDEVLEFYNELKIYVFDTAAIIK